MDADVYGPSIPHLFGIHETPRLVDEQDPAGRGRRREDHVDGPAWCRADEAVVWRGPMLHKALTQFVRDTVWGDLDYLVVDMPPGTGDVAISLSQLLPSRGGGGLHAAGRGPAGRRQGHHHVPQGADRRRRAWSRT